MAVNEQFTVRLEIQLLRRTDTLQPSSSRISDVIPTFINTGSRNLSFMSQTSRTSVLPSPNELAITQKNEDDKDVKKRQNLLKEISDFMKYLQGKYSLNASQLNEILERSVVPEMKTYEGKPPSSSSKRRL